MKCSEAGAQTSWIAEVGACLHHPAHCGDGRLTVGSLFAGIGGFDIGLESVGMVTRWQVEIDPFCRSVLAKHWPDVVRYDDIRQVDWSTAEPVDVVCGGFPCQPVSVAGKQRGEDDERWLWPEFARCIRETRPRFAVLENVPGLLTADGGRLFGGILGDLAALGYNAEWRVLSARDVGAPHLRQRLWIIAYASDSDEGGRIRSSVVRFGELVDNRQTPGRRGGIRRTPDAPQSWPDESRPEPGVCRVDDGISKRVDWRRFGATGNAIVPQVAAVVGRRVIELATSRHVDQHQPSDGDAAKP